MKDVDENGPPPRLLPCIVLAGLILLVCYGLYRLIF